MTRTRDESAPDAPSLRAERILSLFLLLAGGRLHSAPDLARRFGVSARTLYRDLDLLSAWGCPIESIPGREGGFRILPGYALDRSVLDRSELAAASAALAGVEEAVGGRGLERAAAKIDALLGRPRSRRSSWLRISLAPGRDERALVELLRDAIEGRRTVQFGYRDAEGRRTDRTVEPAAVVYLWEGWYLWAYCRLRRGWRHFKLARIERPRTRIERFEPRPEPSEEAWRGGGGTRTDLRIRVAPAALPRFEEDLGRGFGTPDGRGGRIAELRMPAGEWLFDFLLGFGDGIEVLGPPELRAEFAARARRVAELYETPGNSDKP
ncbi:MAG TPA: YafY family protein [Spirochaetia bacterium]|nr:YafY family protein [Spirochaetales bacterium]HRY79895.1 YafY family protein [Spirochaetia bacterium]HRZ88932.1 YafY family protein [Spirochaetia bacterium]